MPAASLAVLGYPYGMNFPHFGAGCLLLLTAATAQAQTLTYDSKTHSDFAKPHAAVAAGQTVAPGWTDIAGGVYSVTDGTLYAYSTDTTGYFKSLALRPATETAKTPNVEATVDVPNGLPGPGIGNGLVLRYQPDGTFYLFQLSQDTLFAYKISGTTVSQLGSVPVHPDFGHAYSLTGSAVNAGSLVTLAAAVQDTRTGKSIGTLSVADASNPITQAGRVGVDSWVSGGGPGPALMAYSRLTVRTLPPGQRPGTDAAPKIGFIGDSITAGYNQAGQTITPGTNDVAALTIKKLSQTKAFVRVNAGVPWSLYDRGNSGSSTRDWLPDRPDGLEVKAKTAFAAAFGTPNPKTNPVWVLVMLGTNDVRSGELFPPETHQKNLQAITDDLVASGYNVVLNQAPSFNTATAFNGVKWDANSLALLQSYQPGEKAIVDSFAKRVPGRVFLGDTEAFAYFSTRLTLFQEYGLYGGLHPNGNGGTDALATLWATAFARVYR